MIPNSTRAELPSSTPNGKSPENATGGSTTPDQETKIRCSVTESVRKQLLARSERGFQKYGKTLDRNDLTHGEWLQHLQEELLDAACYIEVLKRWAENRSGLSQESSMHGGQYDPSGFGSDHL
jgi:hypothetical protein